jgi:hypothetical protein
MRWEGFTAVFFLWCGATAEKVGVWIRNARRTTMGVFWMVLGGRPNQILRVQPRVP